MADPVPEPKRTDGPAADWKHRDLYEDVLDALHALPSRFRTELKIAGISATDLFTLNTPLGAAIEQSVVENLNAIRDIWDADGTYELYSFVRQTQVFPDVLLMTTAPGVAEEDRIIMGIELKGWFILSKEGEPSFRYKASPEVCQPQDLLVVYPWTLNEVISGSPKLKRPFVEEARFAAQRRNYYWQEGRKGEAKNPDINFAPDTAPYPSKKSKFNDEAVADKGNNFGRIARARIMDEFIAALMEEPISGIPAVHWQRFLTIFADGISTEDAERKLLNLRKVAERAGLLEDDPTPFDKIEEGLSELMMR